MTNLWTSYSYAPIPRWRPQLTIILHTCTSMWCHQKTGMISVIYHPFCHCWSTQWQWPPPLPIICIFLVHVFLWRVLMLLDPRSTARNGASVASMPHFFTHMTLALVLTVGGVKGTNTIWKQPTSWKQTQNNSMVLESNCCRWRKGRDYLFDAWV